MEAEGNLDSPVFCTKPGNYVQGSTLTNDTWSKILKKARVEYRKFHAIRHTHATQLLHDGVSVVAVAHRLGDDPALILKVYYHAMPAGGPELTDQLDKLYRTELDDPLRPPVTHGNL